VFTPFQMRTREYLSLSIHSRRSIVPRKEKVVPDVKKYMKRSQLRIKHTTRGLMTTMSTLK